MVESALSYCMPCYTAAHPTHPQRFLWQQRIFRRPTNVSKRLRVVSLPLNGYSKSVLSESHHIVSVIIHSVDNQAV